MQGMLSDVELDKVIARYFRGSRPLYDVFLAGCLKQFSVDIQAIDLALLQADSASVRRVAHNIKSAMTMLGYTTLGAQALSIELAAQSDQLEQVSDTWCLLCSAMHSMQTLTNAGLDTAH